MCNYCGVEKAIAEIDKLINDKRRRYMYAYDTLKGIKDTIIFKNHVTPPQLRAVRNIREGAKR